MSIAESLVDGTDDPESNRPIVERPPVQQDVVLDRSIDLTSVSWWSIGIVISVALAVLVRFLGLDWFALSADEGTRSFQSLALFDGRDISGGATVPDTSPVFHLGQTASYFLFGVTDVTARVLSGFAGVGIVLLAAAMRPFVGPCPSLLMAILAAVSPTLMYASRMANPEILVAFFALLLVVAVLYVGKTTTRAHSSIRWSVIAGISIGGLLASGPTAITVLICLVAGAGAAVLAERGSDGIMRDSLQATFGRGSSLVPIAVSAVITMLFLFSHGVSDLSALSGIGETIADWGSMLATDASSTPTQFFLISVLLYEIVVIFGAAAALILDPGVRKGGISSAFFAGWFVAALLLFSFSSGRDPAPAIHVALPLVLWGATGLSSLLTYLSWSGSNWKQNGLLVATLAALFGSILAFFSRMGSVSDSTDTGRAVFEVFAIIVLGILPLSIALLFQVRDRTDDLRTQAKPVVAALGIALLFFLTAYSVRATVMLNYYRVDTSTELLAQQTSTSAIPALVDQVTNLSRDLTVRDGSTRDPTGGHGISIAMEEATHSPFQWYFRDFPDAIVVDNGQAVSTGSDFLIANDIGDMEIAGYAPRSVPVKNRVPPEYATPSLSSIVKSIVLPSHWSEGSRFLLYRDGLTIPDPQPAVVGYGPELSNRLFPSSGPYSIDDRPGPGTGRGQLNQPRGIAVATGDGAILVVDMGNGRVERYSSGGSYEATWGGPESDIGFNVTPEGLGPTGIAVGFDGLVYVADTWNHRIVVLNQAGQLVREFGTFADTLDAEDPSVQPGAFFGPRSIATTATEIFVTDTGNERVQVFAPDGTFLRAWGGFGSGPDQLIEPVGIGISPDGRVFVADSGNGRISVFARDGTPLEQWPVAAWSGQQFFEPYLTFDRWGRLYATSAATGSIEVFDLDGTFLTSISDGTTEQLEAPVGIASALDGSLLVTDRSIGAVVRVAVLPEPEEADISAEASPTVGSPTAAGTPEPEA